MKVFVGLCLLTIAVTTPVDKKLGDHWSYAAGYEECPGWVDPAKTIPKPIEKICGGTLECPGYEDMANTSCGFGARRIAAGKWVGTKVNIRKGGQGYSEAFKRLFNYITFENEEGGRINMTAPVITKGYLNQEFDLIDSTMHFFIPSDLANPPAPTSNLVYIEDWEEITVYFRVLGESSGKITEAEWEEEFTNLSAALEKSEIGYNSYLSVVGGFTDPWSPQQRTEVMLVKA